jgi:hypothetical protein
MAGKQVLPLCHSGFRTSDLPVIYGLLQAMDVCDAGDVARLLDQIAKNTPARKLLVGRSRCVGRWIDRISAACLLIPAARAGSSEPPCVWLVGSNRGLSKKQAALNEKFVGFLAHAMTPHRFRVVFGRSGLLERLGTTMATKTIGPNGSNVLKLYANASAMMKNVDHAPPNPVVVLGSLRTKRGARSMFFDAIGRIPNVVLAFGGSPNGRTSEEAALAKAAKIPVLPLRFTGGSAAKAKHSFATSLDAEIRRLQGTKCDYGASANDLCQLIIRQTAITRMKV